jgi:hypothetical protein
VQFILEGVWTFSAIVWQIAVQRNVISAVWSHGWLSVWLLPVAGGRN